MTWRARCGSGSGSLAIGWMAAVIAAGLPLHSPAATANYRTMAVGSDSVVWVAVGGAKALDGSEQNWLAYLDKTSAEIHGVAGPLPQAKRIVRLAAAGPFLHIFYEDGTHYRYGPRSSRRELKLPEAVVPEAVAGDELGKQAQIWAVVEASSAEAVGVNWQRKSKSRTTQPASRAAPASSPETLPSIGGLPAGGYQIVRYNGGDWQPDVSAPVIPVPSERIWLAVADGRYHLFWQRGKQDHRIQYAWGESGKWTIAPSLDLPSLPQEVSVSVGNHQLLLIAMLAERGQSTWKPHAYMRPARSTSSDDREWSEIPTLETAEGKSLSLPIGSAGAAFGDQIALIRNSGEKPELALWGARGAKPNQAFKAIPLSRSVTDPGERDRPDLKTGVALAALLLLVFWRRHTTFAAPVPLPPGIVLAGTGRRLLAGVIDMLPALLVVGLWWHDDFYQAFKGLPGADPAQIEDVWPRLIFLPSIVFRVIYIVYCFGFEVVWNRTPGKWVTGSTVMSETLTPPNWIQIAVRNVTRLIEFETYLPISLPLLLLVLITRNRQRLGDLLAHTLVVQPGMTLPSVPEQDSE